MGIAPYFREYLRKTLQAKEPKRKNYASWQLKPYGQYYLDSLEWENNPLYGWIEKNPKADGSKYDIYHDGLKIHTTIDARMQRYAEKAVEEHFTDMQAKFMKTLKYKKNPPFANNTTQEDVDRALNPAMRPCDRYHMLKNEK